MLDRDILNRHSKIDNHVQLFFRSAGFVIAGDDALDRLFIGRLRPQIHISLACGYNRFIFGF